MSPAAAERHSRHRGRSDERVVERLQGSRTEVHGEMVAMTRPDTPTAPGRVARGLIGAALVVVTAVGVSACGGQQEQRSALNLCARYQQLAASVDEVKAASAGTPTADAVRRRAEVALSRLDELQAVSEGRYDTLISTLRTAINDLKQSAANAGAAAAQARSEALQELTESVAPLKERLEVQCGSAR